MSNTVCICTRMCAIIKDLSLVYIPSFFPVAISFVKNDNALDIHNTYVHTLYYKYIYIQYTSALFADLAPTRARVIIIIVYDNNINYNNDQLLRHVGVVGVTPKQVSACMRTGGKTSPIADVNAVTINV